MILLKDAVSHMKPDVVYGRKGEDVKIISDHGNLIIVEGKSGRFPVLKENLADEVVQVKRECSDSKGSAKDIVQQAAKFTSKNNRKSKGSALDMPSLFQ
jgi:hypothetical protein